MTPSSLVGLSAPDPLIKAIAHRNPMDLERLDAAIHYRETLQDQLNTEIDVLKVARARLLNQSQ